jgi:hypothetical protein
MTPAQRLSPHFLLSELIVTNTGIDNYPDTDEDIATLGRTAIKMEEVRKLLGNNPIKVNSAYRNMRVNKAVGGVSNSQHKLGEAVDFTCAKFGTPAQICKFLRENVGLLDYDQLILEPAWVHISWNTSRTNRGKPNRRQYIDLSKG